MRLAKYLAHAGVASRRAAERMIAEGRVRVAGEAVRVADEAVWVVDEAVTVAGEVVTDPARDVQEGDRVEVDGRPIAGPEPRAVYALNKPLGVVSSARDTHGRPTVVDLVSAPGLRLYPVGRLDTDTTGLILLTNDGALADRLTHPRYEVPRTYRARVGGGPVGEHALRTLRRGVLLEDGPTAPAEARRPGGRTGDLLELTLREGRNRQVRRMCAAVGHPVLELTRVAFGPLRLDGLAPGASRRLSQREVAQLRGAAA